MAVHVVRRGECIASIAFDHGLPVEVLVEANADLESERGELGILAEGDQVEVPEVRPKHVEVDGTGSYVVRLVHIANPITMRFTRISGEPLLGERVALKVDGVPVHQERTTGDDGHATFLVPAWAKTGSVIVGDPGLAMPVTFGDLDPITTIRGVQGRLKQLGYYWRDVDGEIGPFTHQALRAFQRDAALETTAELDDRTRSLIAERAGV